MTQLITSKDTSLNQVPATFKRVAWVSGNINFDIGAGKYTKFTEALANVGVTNYSYDPYHLTYDENKNALMKTYAKADTVTVNNVLNVISEQTEQLAVIKTALKAVSLNGTAYFLIYEGNKSGNGKETTKGWQWNTKAEKYVDLIKVYFSNVQRKGNLIIAKYI